MQLLLPAAVFLLMVSIGMSLKWSELVAHWRRLHWRAWILLLLVTFLVPAAAALLLARGLSLTLPETGGLFMVAIAPGAPLTSRNAAKKGFDMQLAASYQVWGALLTPIMVPLLLFAAGKLYNRNIWIPPRLLIAQIAEKQFLPLLIGMGLVCFAAGFTRKVQPAITVLGNILLLVMMAAALWKMRAALASLTPWLAVATFLLAVTSMLAVPVFLPTDAATRKTLALCNANRHIGLALLLAGEQLHSQRSLPTVACYALVASIVMLVYARVFHQRKPLAASA